MVYFIDTNIFIRVLIKEDEKTYADCICFLKLVKNNDIEATTSSAVLAEIVWVLKSFYKFGKGELVKAMKSIVNIGGLKVIETVGANLAVEIFEKNNIKFIDALIASIKEIRNKEWTVVSYDKDFDKLGVLRKEPGEVKFNFDR